jgi:hypothetical protein
LRVPLAAPRAASLAPIFGVDAHLLARAFEIAGDPAPASAHAILTAYLETAATPAAAYDAVASPEGYRRLLQGVAEVGDFAETSSGFRLTLSPGPGGSPGAGPEARLEEEISVDPAAGRLSVVRRAGSTESRSSYRAQDREGKTWLLREIELGGAREDLLRNDSLRGRLAAGLAVDLLAWARML